MNALGPFAADDGRSPKARKPVAAAINSRIAAAAIHRLGRCLRAAARHDVPAGPMVEPAAVAALPQSAQRDKFAPDAGAPLVRYPVTMAGVRPGALGPAPALDSARS